jgi:hypothetical protein
LEALRNVKNLDGTPSFLGQINFGKNKKGQLVFSRTIDKIDLGQKEEAGEENDLAGQMSAAMLSGYNWKYTIHFPAKVIGANTANENINANTNTVIWEIPLSTFSQGPQTLTATIQAPIPWALIIIIIVAAAIVVVVIALAILKFAKKPAAA